MKLLFWGIFCLAAFSVSALEITPEFVIVTERNAIAPEKKSVEILNDYLGRIFGKKLRVIPEHQHDGTIPAVYVGNTAFAIRNGAAGLASEEHFIKTAGNSLILTGGRPRGVLFGVYEFLERFAGCRKLAVDAEFVPRRKSITVPEKEIYRAQPYFSARFLFSGITSCGECAAMKSWYRMNVSSCYPPGGKEDLYRYYSLRRDGGGHTFYSYARTIPSHETDCFSLIDGKRLRGPHLQLCLSNPKTRKYVKDELRRRIEWNQRNVKAGKEIRNSWYDISTSDSEHGNCTCGSCRALEAKYGNAYAGAVFDFINEIAAEFPKETIQTFGAYGCTAKIPENIRVRDNVMLNLAVQCTTFVNTQTDILSPFSHPANAAFIKWLDKWFELGTCYAVFDYGRIYSQAVPSPYTLIHTLSSKFRYYAGQGKVRSYCIEIEPNDLSLLVSPPAFYDLQVYLSAKLMYDPTLAVEPVRREYMKLYYRSAVSEMEQYYQFLVASQQKNSVPIPSVPLAKRDYLNFDFFSEAERILAEAEQAAEKDEELIARIGQERIGLDFAYLYLAELYKWNTEQFPTDREKIINRLEKNLMFATDKYLKKHRSYPQALQKARGAIARLRNTIPVPPMFQDKSILQYSVLDSNYSLTAANDANALFGKAFQVKTPPGSWKGSNADYHAKPMEAGVWCDDTKTFALRKKFSEKEYKQDEKYHFYYLGKMKVPAVPAKTVMYFHWRWDLRLSSIIKDVSASVDPNTEFDVYLSVKLEGPAYVNGSEKQNCISVDRVVFVFR